LEFTMKLFSVIVLACSILSTQAQECNGNLDACADSANIAQIMCPGNSAPCTINGTDLEGLLNVDGPDAVINSIDEKLCRSICQKHADMVEIDEANKCKFFRFQDEHEDRKHCSLQTDCLNDDTCDTDVNCVTGELGCTKDGIRIKDCTLKVADWNHDKFHIICFTQSGNQDVNIYIQDEQSEVKNIPGGTICSTVKKCAEWNEIDEIEGAQFYKRKLAVECDLTNGEWKAMPTTGSLDKSTSMAAKANANTIEEPTCCKKSGNAVEDEALDLPEDCDCDPLSDPHTNQAWADLFCDNPLVGNKVKDPNFCMLLCDNHIEKSFADKIDEEGNKKWKEEDGTTITEANLKC